MITQTSPATAVHDSLALEFLGICEREGLDADQLPCSACGSSILADATVCPECDADPRAESDPCPDCEDGTHGESYGGIIVDRRNCLTCKGYGEIQRSGYDSRADVIRARELRGLGGAA
jgi:hypothetical protein